MATQHLPLTPAMRATVGASLRRTLRGTLPRLALVCFGVPILMTALALLDGSWREPFWQSLLGLLYGIAAGATLLIGVAVIAVQRIRARRVMSGGTYARYAGPLSYRVEWQGYGNGRRLVHTLWMGEQVTIDERAGTPVEVSLADLSRGVVAHAPGGPLIFAIWDDEGRCAYHHNDYDPWLDSEVARPAMAAGRANDHSPGLSLEAGGAMQ